MATNEKKPKLTIKLSPEPNKIELFDEYHIDDKIKSTACIPYLEYLFKVCESPEFIIEIIQPTPRN
jgi:hypothetical protein